MFLWIGIGVVAGMVLGLTVGRAWMGSRMAPEMREKNRLLDEAREREAAQREERSRLEEAARQVGQQMAELRVSLDRMAAEAEQCRREAHAAQIEAAELRKTLEGETNAAEEKITIIQSAREELSNQFKALANDILEQKSKTFTEQNQANLSTLLNPLREKFGEFQQKVESLERDGISGRTELKTQIEQLRTLNARLSTDAANLVTALKGSSKTRGDWGELVLEKLLESAGLRRNVEYRVQSTLGREEGGNARLDVILDLPDDRHLVIDSKVSLNSYTDYCNTESEEERKQALRSHLQSVRGHLKELSAREYQDLYGLKSLDFVLMFVPVEPAFMLAIANDNRLWQDAYEKNVLLVSPSSLLCVVRTVAQIWRQEQQARNVEEIAKRGRILLDKFVGFTDDLQRIGRKLGEAKEAYEGAYNKLTRADGNLVSQAQKLVRLGIRPNKTLPQPLLDQAMEAEEGFELAAESEEPGRPH
ncbi:MAG TPA: DNA recombination protein RmuC [Acidobacteriaceae bacterium]|jgi:DNA recombination protein RmuC|nr:DNA recombination protein RmuC [Acidobacteriaceae bacterium]